ncbi:MAG: Mu-like prophage major head subunit gpT family protein [Alsobacter sp.]
MSGIQRPAALEALNTTLFKTFQEAMNTPSFAETNGFFTTMPSSSEFNTYGWMATLAGMREWIGPRVYEGLKERAYTIYNKTYEKTIAVPRDRLDDGQVADAQFAMGEIARSAAQLPDDLLLALLEGGQASSVGGLAYDGQFFYDTDHPVNLDSTGTQRNYYASALALDATNIKSAIALMQAYKNEANRPLGIGDSGPLTVLVSPSQWGALLDAVDAKTVSTGGENILSTKYNIRPIKWARLSSATRWFIFDLSSPGPKPFILQRRRNPTFVSKTAGSDPNVFERNEYVWGADCRMGAGYGMWFKAFSAAT